MSDAITELRTRFECETDIKLDPTPEDWKQYATWLEKEVETRINAEAISENHLLRDTFFQVSDLLEQTLTRLVHVGK